MSDSLADLAADLLKAAVAAPLLARGVVKIAAQGVTSAAQENVRRSAPTHNAGAHRAITYDEPSLTGGTHIESEAGYDRSLPGGALGNLLEYGGGGDHSPPHRDIGRAADAAEVAFEQAVAKMAGRLL